MCEIYEILNNATIAAIIAVLVAGYLASLEYRRQKNLDKDFNIKKEIVNNILNLQEKIYYVLLIINRIANTRAVLTKDKNAVFKNVLNENEIPRLSLAINEDIPLILAKIKLTLEMYYVNNKEVLSDFKLFESELKKWHEILIFRKFDIMKKVKDQENLSKVPIDNRAKKLIDTIWKKNIY